MVKSWTPTIVLFASAVAAIAVMKHQGENHLSSYAHEGIREDFQILKEQVMGLRAEIGSLRGIDVVVNQLDTNVKLLSAQQVSMVARMNSIQEEQQARTHNVASVKVMENEISHIREDVTDNRVTLEKVREMVEKILERSE